MITANADATPAGQGLHADLYSETKQLSQPK